MAELLSAAGSEFIGNILRVLNEAEEEIGQFLTSRLKNFSISSAWLGGA